LNTLDGVFSNGRDRTSRSTISTRAEVMALKAKIGRQMHSAESRYIRPNGSGLMRMYLIFQCIYSPSLIYPLFRTLQLSSTRPDVSILTAESLGALSRIRGGVSASEIRWQPRSVLCFWTRGYAGWLFSLSMGFFRPFSCSCLGLSQIFLHLLSTTAVTYNLLVGGIGVLIRSPRNSTQRKTAAPLMRATSHC
jgi:hypothetical protein